MLCLDSKDHVIAILRKFNWSQDKIEEEWFSDPEKLNLDIGLVFDQNIRQKHP